jgi:hypothetical protein
MFVCFSTFVSTPITQNWKPFFDTNAILKAVFHLYAFYDGSVIPEAISCPPTRSVIKIEHLR